MPEVWKKRAIAEHAAEVTAGKHDAECEWRDAGHFLCHCAKRRRVASGFTTLPGELIHQSPLCPRCDNEVDVGDGWDCATCQVHWSYELGDTGTFTDDYGDLDPTPYDQPGVKVV